MASSVTDSTHMHRRMYTDTAVKWRNDLSQDGWLMFVSLVAVFRLDFSINYEKLLDKEANFTFETCSVLEWTVMDFCATVFVL